MHTNLRNSKYRGKFPTPDPKPKKRADLLLPQSPPITPARSHHARVVDKNPDQPLRSTLLQLCPLSSRRGSGDAVFHVAKDNIANTSPPSSFPPTRRLSARCNGRNSR